MSRDTSKFSEDVPVIAPSSKVIVGHLCPGRCTYIRVAVVGTISADSDTSCPVTVLIRTETAPIS